MHYSSNGKITTPELWLWWQNTLNFSVFLIESAQHLMLFVWIGSLNYKVFLFGSGYRSASGDKVIIKRWVCHISSSGVGGGSAGGSTASLKILVCWKFGQNLLKFGQNPWKFGKNPWKSEQNPQMSRKNPWKFGQKWRPRLLYFKKLSPNVCRKTSENHFLKGHTKKRSAKLAQKLFGQVWKNLGKNPLLPQKFACSYTYD